MVQSAKTKHQKNISKIDTHASENRPSHKETSSSTFRGYVSFREGTYCICKCYKVGPEPFFRPKFTIHPGSRRKPPLKKMVNFQIWKMINPLKNGKTRSSQPIKKPSWWWFFTKPLEKIESSNWTIYPQNPGWTSQILETTNTKMFFFAGKT